VWKGKQVYPHESTSVARPRRSSRWKAFQVEGAICSKPANQAVDFGEGGSSRVPSKEGHETRVREKELARFAPPRDRERQRFGAIGIGSLSRRAQGVYGHRSRRNALVLRAMPSGFTEAATLKKRGTSVWGFGSANCQPGTRNRPRTMMPRSAASAARVGSPRSEDR